MLFSICVLITILRTSSCLQGMELIQTNGRVIYLHALVNYMYDIFINSSLFSSSNIRWKDIFRCCICFICHLESKIIFPTWTLKQINATLKCQICVCFYRYTAPKLAIANLYWKGWILLAIVASLNPLSIGKSGLCSTCRRDWVPQATNIYSSGIHSS